MWSHLLRQAQRCQKQSKSGEICGAGKQLRSRRRRRGTQVSRMVPPVSVIVAGRFGEKCLNGKISSWFLVSFFFRLWGVAREGLLNMLLNNNYIVVLFLLFFPAMMVLICWDLFVRCFSNVAELYVKWCWASHNMMFVDVSWSGLRVDKARQLSCVTVCDLPLHHLIVECCAATFLHDCYCNQNCRMLFKQFWFWMTLS